MPWRLTAGLRILTVMDSFTRECPAIEVNTGLSGQRVTRLLERVITERGSTYTRRFRTPMTLAALLPEFDRKMLDKVSKSCLRSGSKGQNCHRFERYKPVFSRRSTVI